MNRYSAIRRFMNYGIAGVLYLICSSLQLQAQTRIAPKPGLQFLDESMAGSFKVQRWGESANPEGSPSGICDCVTVIYSGDRKILSVDPGTIISTTVDSRSGQDINGDKLPDLIVSQYTGGAHCCSSTTVYAVSTELKKILDVDSGNCPGEFEDLNHDGKMEFLTCDDAWAYVELERKTIDKVRSNPFWVAQKP